MNITIEHYIFLYGKLKMVLTSERGVHREHNGEMLHGMHTGTFRTSLAMQPTPPLWPEGKTSIERQNTTLDKADAISWLINHAIASGAATVLTRAQALELFGETVRGSNVILLINDPSKVLAQPGEPKSLGRTPLAHTLERAE